MDSNYDPNISVTNISANMVEWQVLIMVTSMEMFLVKPIGSEIDKYDYRQKKQLYAPLLKLI